jgi:hypothetical protein
VTRRHADGSDDVVARVRDAHRRGFSVLCTRVPRVERELERFRPDSVRADRVDQVVEQRAIPGFDCRRISTEVGTLASDRECRREGAPMPGPTREWVTFVDPKDELRRWQIDVTFLLSKWTCIFGRGCQGVLTGPAPDLVQGCCSYGAHFSNRKDRDHIARVARSLSDDEWQFAASGRKKGIYAKAGKDDDGKQEWRTRLVEDACIFLNRPGFSGGVGCALHLHAMRTGKHHSEVKPEVCWQLPLRRVDEEQEDGGVVSTLTEFGRDGWGEGGEEFWWWCTEEPSAFVGRAPVYRELGEELRKMLGDKLYRQVVAYLEQREHARPAPVRHPAERPVKLGRTRRRTQA